MSVSEWEPTASFLKVYKSLVKGGPRKLQPKFDYKPQDDYIWAQFVSKPSRVQAFQDGLLKAISSFETEKTLRFKSDKYGSGLTLCWIGVCEIEDEIICFACHSHKFAISEVHVIKFGDRSHRLLEQYPELLTEAAALATKIAARGLDKTARPNIKVKPAKTRTKV